MTECALPGCHRPAMSPGHMEYCCQDHADKSWHMPYETPKHPAVSDKPWFDLSLDIEPWWRGFWVGMGTGIFGLSGVIAAFLYAMSCA